jgi:HD-GYP domain-containing protein (c-di-GMP phosphodiesterase class II)
MAYQTKRFPFYVGISTLILVVVLSMTGLFLWISHRESKSAAVHMADRLFSEINDKTLDRYENALKSVAVLSGLATRMPGMSHIPVEDGLSHPGLNLMQKALDSYDYLFSTYIGYPDGSFIQLTAVRDHPEYRRLFGAPADTVYVLRVISPSAEATLKTHWSFLDRKWQVIGERPDLDPDYDPRTRPWYQRAQAESTAFFTEPYVFSTTRLPGITCAEKLANGGGVFGADITLHRFSESLARQRISENGLLFLFDRRGRIIAHPEIDPVKPVDGDALTFLNGSESDDPRVRRIVADYKTNPDVMHHIAREVMIDGSAYLIRSAGMSATLDFDQILASVAPVSDFTAHIRLMQQRVFIFSGVVLLVMLPLVLAVSRKISSALVRLELESRKIQQSDFSETAPFDSAVKEIHTLIQAFFLMKTKIRGLLKQQRKLFEDFTKLIAGAIDAKSPYTGGHCARVPVVAKMLATAAHEADSGPFANFEMATEDRRWEFEVAAWLHDCGKVTTPEYVVDKATKLETLYNRIHEIRTRFEVLLRDAQIDAYRRHLAGVVIDAALQAELADRLAQIKADFAFVAECNIGGEFMADDKIARLEQIAARTWVRHLDDRLGISQDEAALKNRHPAPDLPVVEPVLADKPEHIVPRSNPAPFGENPHGFKMDVPTDQYNLGELYNLSIRKGTLTVEDRFKINDHIIQTIVMLNQLDFPEYLANVAEFAGAHHETMIGTGYPRGLKKEAMSIPARIMAIADIFEALTAADRPYKKSKSLSEALRIMSFMRNDQHIDADLFDLFLESGVYLTYAEQFMDPSQIDKVDIDAYHSAKTQPSAPAQQAPADGG